MKNITDPAEIAAIIAKFKHKTTHRVQFSEVDSVGATHNVSYLYWIEQAKIEYFRDSGLPINPRTFLREFPLMVVRTEIDYFAPSYFDDEISLLSRIPKIGTTSLSFEHLLIRDNTTICASSKGVMVHLDPETGKPTPIPEEYKKILLR
jgi:acyl-CoA thioester hydrolase